jgi:hypothetical protein
MPIYARRKESNFAPAPEGLHVAVCADVWEPWTEERREDWGGGLVDKTRIVWLLEEVNPKTNKPYEVSQIYTLSLHEKAKLCGHLESWRGRKFSESEKQGFDIEKLIGVPCQVQVVHNVKDGGSTFANVQAIVPLGKNQAKLRVPQDYVRRKDRVVSSPSDDANKFHAPDDEEVPF